MKTEKEIRAILDKFEMLTEKEIQEQLGSDHYLVWTTLQWVVGEIDEIPMGLPDSILERR